MKLLNKIAGWGRRRGFFDGMASVLNIFPVTKPAEFTIPSLLHSDAETIAGDWAVVGADISRAIKLTAAGPGHLLTLPQNAVIRSRGFDLRDAAVKLSCPVNSATAQNVGTKTQKAGLTNSGRVLTYAIKPKLHGAR